MKIVPRQLLPVLLLCLLCSGLRSQQLLRGVILSVTDRSPVAYASVGLKHITAGTISEKDGSFSLQIPATGLSDTLLISSLGYSTRRVPVTLLLKTNQPILLAEKITVLTPVTVSTVKRQSIITELGSTAFNGGVYEPDTLYAGRTIALLIDPTTSLHRKGFSLPSTLGLARLRIFRNNLAVCRFRIRIIAVDPLSGEPGADLLDQDLIVESTKRKGWLNFDLSPLNVEVDKPFYLCFEQILDSPERSAIAVAYNGFIKRYPERVFTDTILIDGKKQVVKSRLGRGAIDLPGTFIAVSTSRSSKASFKSYERETSFGKWKEVNGIPAATITLVSSGNAYADPGVCDTLLASCKADRYFRDMLDERSIPGLQVTVTRNGANIWSASYGYANLRKQIPVTDSTTFRINSISKSVTALGLMKLVSQRKLNLDSPISEYLGSSPAWRNGVTLRQAAGHLGGFRDYDEDNLADYIRTKHYRSATDALEVFQNDLPLSRPGTAFNYSPFGFNTIGAVIEKVSSQLFIDWIRQEVFIPLGLSSFAPDAAGAEIRNRSRFYDSFGEDNDLGDLSYKYPAGGFIASSHDLSRFGNAILDAALIGTSLRNTMIISQKLPDGTATGYGIGWYTGVDHDGRRIWYHTGDSFSGSSHLLIYPDEKLVISILANSQEGVMVNPQYIGGLFIKKSR